MDLIKLIWAVVWVLLPVKARIVRQGSLGTRLTHGRPGPNLQPGLHWATTGQDILRHHAALNYIGMDQIELTMKCGTSIVVDGVATFTIEDLAKFLTRTEDSDDLVSEFAEATMQQFLTGITLADARSDPKTSGAQMQRHLQAQCRAADMGVKIRYLRIKSLRIVEPLARAALALALAAGALQALPATLGQSDPAFGAKVALLAHAHPTNAIALPRPPAPIPPPPLPPAPEPV